MNASSPTANEETLNERHDGADLCPMCLTELLLPVNACPKCGAAVNSAGIMEAQKGIPELEFTNQNRLHRLQLMIWLHALTALCFAPSLATPSRTQWLYILVISLNLIHTWRVWRDYRALKAGLEPTST
jgi:hypothetical protein